MLAQLDIKRLSTVQLVTPTPFTEDGSRIVPEILAEHTTAMAEAGIRVFVPAAGTGEFHSLSADEVVECVRVTHQAAGSESIVIAPIGFGLNHAIEIGTRARDAGADALLLMSPIHPYLCDEGFRDYFFALSSALPLPLLAYKRSSVPSDSLLLELAHSGRLIGVKYAVNDLDAFCRFVRLAPPRLGLYCGTAERFAPFFALAGATGFTSGAANLCPHLSLKLHTLLSARAFDDAMEVLQAIRPLEDFRARADESYNISAIKCALAMAGRKFGPPRSPQSRVTSAQEKDLRLALESLLKAELQVGNSGSTTVWL